MLKQVSFSDAWTYEWCTFLTVMATDLKKQHAGAGTLVWADYYYTYFLYNKLMITKALLVL